MGRSLLLFVALAALGGIFIQSGRGDGRTRADERSARDQRFVLAEMGAAGGLDAAASRISRDFSDWRAGYPETRAGDLTFQVSAEGPAAGPVRLTALGSHGSARHQAELILARLAQGPAALVLDADTARVSLSGSNWALSGADARARTWLHAATPAEGSGYGNAVHGVRTRSEGLRQRLLEVAGGGRDNLIRGVRSSADVEQSTSPELLALADAARGNVSTGHLYASGYAPSGPATMGTASAPVVAHVKGDFRASGAPFTGYGLLLVEGDFEVRGSFEWHGVVIVNGSSDLSVSLAGDAAVYGALYMLHESGYRLGSAVYPFKSMWGVNDQTGTLHWFVVGRDSISSHTEGLLQGVGGPMTYGDKMDVEGFAFMPDGTAYFVNNNSDGDYALYRIPSNQFDGDETTPVRVVRVGNTGVYSDNEVFGLVVKNGVLYGLSGDSRRIYTLNTTTGAAVTLRTFTTGTSDFAAGGLSLGPDGTVFTNRLLSSGELELWRFDQFPSGNPVRVGSLGPREMSGSEASGSPLAVTPDGTVFLHQRTELRRGRTTGGVESILDLIADVDAVEMFWEGEGGSGSAAVPSLDILPAHSGPGTHTGTVPWSSGPDVTVTSRIWKDSNPTSYVGPPSRRGTTLQAMRASADLNHAPVANGAADLDYDGPTPLPMYVIGPGRDDAVDINWEVRMDFSEDWTETFYVYVADLDYRGVVISAQDASGAPVSTAGWRKTMDLDVVGARDVAPYVWSPDGSWTNTSGIPGAGRLIHPLALSSSFPPDQEMGFVGIEITDRSVRSVTFTGSNPATRSDGVAVSLSVDPLFVTSGARPIPSFSMGGNARVIHSAESIGKLAPLLSEISVGAWVVKHDRFGRDLQ